MNILIIIGTLWICISVLNYMYYIPEEQKKKTTFVAFVGFAILSPLVTIFIYGSYYLKKLLSL